MRGEREVWTAFLAGDYTRAVLSFSALGVRPHAENLTEPYRSLAAAAVMASCPTNGSAPLSVLAHNMQLLNASKSQPRALRAINGLAQAVRDLDGYRMAKHIGSIRHYGPSTSRARLEIVVSSLIGWDDLPQNKQAEVVLDLADVLPKEKKHG